MPTGEGGASVTRKPQTNPATAAVVVGPISVKAEVVSLNQEVAREALSVDDQIKLGDQSLLQWMTTRIVCTFIGGDLLTLIALVLAGSVGPDQH